MKSMTVDGGGRSVREKKMRIALYKGKVTFLEEVPFDA